jgi:hypothetical protein
MSLVLAACSSVPDIHYSDPATSSSPTEPGADPAKGSTSTQDTPPTGSTGATATGCTPATTIEPNHNGAPHEVAPMSPIDFTAGTTGDRTYQLTSGGSGGSAHTHSFVLTAAQRISIASHTEVAVTTTPGGSNMHTHQVTLVCR